MTDNGLIKIFYPIITAGLLADGYVNVIVQQSNQPTQQGIPTNPTVYFYKIGDKRYGFLGRFDKWDTINSKMVHTETQPYETAFRVQALVLQNPLTPNQYTAADLVNEVASIMQSDNTRAILEAQNIGILRVQDVINPYFVDDRDQFEASPSFDFVLTYLQTRTSVNPVLESENIVIKRI